jgi:hypothetical protein
VYFFILPVYAVSGKADREASIGELPIVLGVVRGDRLFGKAHKKAGYERPSIANNHRMDNKPVPLPPNVRLSEPGFYFKSFENSHYDSRG